MRSIRRSTAYAVVLLALVGVALVVVPRSQRTDVVAYFAKTSGIYAGDEVRVLGVPVGKVDDITPERDRVRVKFHIDRGVKLPADSHAVIVAPSLVSSRYLQVAPRYTGGPILKDGAVIPESRTATPVEWDEIKDQLNDLAVALGPNGANKQGALSRLVTTSAGVLHGQGDSINATLGDLAKAVSALQGGSDDAFTTVKNLQLFVDALNESDQQIATFSERLNSVTGLLADNRHSLRSALATLAVAVRKTEKFVKTNRDAVTTSMRKLGDLSAVVAKQQDSLAQVLHVAPNALANLIESYHERQNAVGVDLHTANATNSPGQIVCQALAGAAGVSGSKAGALCQNVVGDLLDRLASNNASTELLDLLKKLLGVQ